MAVVVVVVVSLCILFQRVFINVVFDAVFPRSDISDNGCTDNDDDDDDDDDDDYNRSTGCKRNVDNVGGSFNSAIDSCGQE